MREPSSGEKVADFSSARLRVTCIIKKEHKFLPDRSSIVKANQDGFDRVVGWRGKIVQWLFQVKQMCTVSPETIGIAVNIMDRWLATETVSRSEIQLLSVVSLLIATKFNESDSFTVPENMVKCGMTSGVIKAKELEILSRMKWEINPPTSYCVMGEILALLPASTSNIYEHIIFWTDVFLQTSLTDFDISVKFLPTQLATGGLLAAFTVVNSHTVLHRESRSGSLSASSSSSSSSSDTTVALEVMELAVAAQWMHFIGTKLGLHVTPGVRKAAVAYLHSCRLPATLGGILDKLVGQVRDLRVAEEGREDGRELDELEAGLGLELGVGEDALVPVPLFESISSWFRRGDVSVSRAPSKSPTKAPPPTRGVSKSLFSRVTSASSASGAVGASSSSATASTVATRPSSVSTSTSVSSTMSPTPTTAPGMSEGGGGG